MAKSRGRTRNNLYRPYLKMLACSSGSQLLQGNHVGKASKGFVQSSRTFGSNSGRISEMVEAAGSFEFERLSIAERLVLVERIWESIERDRLSFTPTEAQRDELERRLAAYRSSGDPGMTWEEVEARLNEIR